MNEDPFYEHIKLSIENSAKTLLDDNSRWQDLEAASVMMEGALDYYRGKIIPRKRVEDSHDVKEVINRLKTSSHLESDRSAAERREEVQARAPLPDYRSDQAPSE